ncbi:hypothetical protein C2R22_10855 [Salinigranum rubrum]|uniref:Uncharacterized protein n=1 Tax=Salinigranum rubrum TaxID=755307 RepID=A0A2I8VJJ9_9EURY|nr:hypothetical protein [Salinigranum rubrum]AUV82085.1 hypothetical protein C2R22_10855 [Salinigranum rubrum]
MNECGVVDDGVSEGVVDDGVDENTMTARDTGAVNRTLEPPQPVRPGRSPAAALARVTHFVRSRAPTADAVRWRVTARTSVRASHARDE